MSNIFSLSIGKKLVMSVTGIFLVVFLLVHLAVNMLLLLGPDSFNLAAHFMATNPAIQIMQPLLGLGFIFHILYASWITLQNRKARPVGYLTENNAESSKWASRNMYILGSAIFIFLVIHLANFFWKMKFGHMDKIMVEGVWMDDSYSLVSGLFRAWWWYPVLYAIASILLGLHLSHGFWSAFQTIGMSNNKWKSRLEIIGNIYSIVIAGGFSLIALFFLFF